MMARLLLCLLVAYASLIVFECALEGNPCAAEGYLHRQSQVFVCAGEARWGREP
jgi:hypothetical protein